MEKEKSVQKQSVAVKRSADPTKVRALLVAAQAIIKLPEHWTRREFARDKDKKAVNTRDTTAFCFCAAGAVDRANGVGYCNDLFSEALKALERVPEVNRNITIYNDALDRTHSEVLAVFTKAIAIIDCALQDDTAIGESHGNRETEL